MTAAITDFSQFSALRVAAGDKDPAAIREVAGQFEALFIQTMLKSMREASLGNPLFGDSNQHELYQGMLDQQLALEMASGKGIGLAELMVRQLGGAASGEGRGSAAGYPLQSPAPPAYSLDGIRMKDGFTLREGGTGNGLPLPDAAWSRSYPLPESSPIAARQQPLYDDPRSFAADVWPHAERAAARLNVAPEAIVAQAALETGWGKHVPQRADGSSSFNLFGIKAGRGWAGASAQKATLEFDGAAARRELAEFRAYDDVATNFDDYSELLLANPRYDAVSGHGDDVAGFAEALQQSGYATDPAYADKLKAVADSDTMRDAISGLKNRTLSPITMRQPSDALREKDGV